MTFFTILTKIRSLAFTLMIPNCRVKLQLRLMVTSYNMTLILLTNKMKFNTDKCKVLTVTKSEPMFINELPFCKYLYTLGQKILDYSSCERDLGTSTFERLDWHERHDYLLKKGYQMLGMTKRSA